MKESQYKKIYTNNLVAVTVLACMFNSGILAYAGAVVENPCRTLWKQVPRSSLWAKKKYFLQGCCTNESRLYIFPLLGLFILSFYLDTEYSYVLGSKMVDLFFSGERKARLCALVQYVLLYGVCVAYTITTSVSIRLVS